MSDPLVVPCPKDAWTKVATAVTYGRIEITGNGPSMWLWTYRETGGAVPVTVNDGVSHSGPEIEINHSTAIDVYAWANNEDGEVEVWL